SPIIQADTPAPLQFLRLLDAGAWVPVADSRAAAECYSLYSMPKLLTVSLVPVFLAAQGGRPAPLDNARVHVVDAFDKPHSHGAMHEHKVNRVMVYLTKCDTRITDAGGAVEQQHWKPGDVAWSPARGPHTSENPNDAACRIIEIELKPVSGVKSVPPGPLD